MFEHVVLRRSDGGNPITVGQISEALLFYQRVHLFIDRGTLFDMVDRIGTEGVLTLMRRPEISAVYCEEILGTISENVGVSRYHNFVAMVLAGQEGQKQFTNASDRLQFEIERRGRSKREARRFTDAFLEFVPVKKISGNYFLPGGIIKAATEDLHDLDFARRAICRALMVVPGGYDIGNALECEVIHSKLGNFVFTNIDFDSINRRRADFQPPLEPLSIAHLLSGILDARADLALAAFYGGDFVTSAITSSIIEVRFAELLRRCKLNQESRHQFLEVTMPDAPAIAEVIDRGERTIDEFFVLLDRAGRFKDWLKKVNPDENLVRTYMRDITSDDWIQRLPAKSLRYMLTQAIDATNPGISLLTGFVDTFLLEKIFSGWRPNHFVSARLSRFVSPLTE